MKTRAAVVVLECTVPAGKDRWVRDTIQAWCRASQFVMKEVELHLEHVWPTKRSRWWAVLVPPQSWRTEVSAVPKSDPMAKMARRRSETTGVGQVRAAQVNSLDKCLYKGTSPLPTVLHGWANQHTACRCGCRAQPMAEKRLKERGMMGALVKMGGTLACQDRELPRCRHLHPDEIGPHARSRLG